MCASLPSLAFSLFSGISNAGRNALILLPGIFACLLAGCAGSDDMPPEDRIIALCEADGESPAICECIAETLSDHLAKDDLDLLARTLETGRSSDELSDLLSRPEFEEAFVASNRCGAPE